VVHQVQRHLSAKMTVAHVGRMVPYETSSLKEGAMLHVWGFLGRVTWALSRGGAVVHCCVSLATQQFKRNAYQQHCCARNNSHGDVSMVTGLLSTWTSTDIASVVLKIARVETCVCIWLRTPGGLKSDLVLRDRPGWTCTCVRRVVDYV
jgi:hypothetical protein